MSVEKLHKIYKGETKHFEIQVKDEDGDAMDLTDVPGIVVALYNRKHTEPIEKWTKVTDVPDATYNSTQFSQRNQVASPGWFDLYMDREKTEKFATGRCFFEIKLELVNVNYASNKEMHTFLLERDVDQKLFELVESELNEVDDLTT